MSESPSFVKNAEYLSDTEISVVQNRNWQHQQDYLRQHSAFYKRHDISSIIPTSFEAFADCPITNKDMLRESQTNFAPFGDYLCSNADIITRVHRTSGTSGVAMNLALSQSDAEMTAKVGARAQSAAGLGPRYRVIHCLNYQLWMGGFTDHTTLEATGATVIPFGVGNSEKLIQTILELNINAISCTPSYPAVLEQTLKKHFPGVQARDLGIKLGLFGGESGLDDPNFRQRLEDTWGLDVRNANYGVSDVFCNFAAQTAFDNDLHFLANDVLYPEIIDPETCQLKPWRTGESGELVLTHLAKQCQPLLRFRTGDIITLTGTGTTSCGRNVPRFKVTGRSDDMVVVRGLNLFPTMISSVLNSIPELSGEYRIVLTSKPPYDFLPIEVETLETISDRQGFEQHIEKLLKKTLGASTKVTALAPQSLPRTDGKTQRVLRQYKDQ